MTQQCEPPIALRGIATPYRLIFSGITASRGYNPAGEAQLLVARTAKRGPAQSSQNDNQNKSITSLFGKCSAALTENYLREAESPENNYTDAYLGKSPKALLPRVARGGVSLDHENNSVMEIR